MMNFTIFLENVIGLSSVCMVDVMRRIVLVFIGYTELIIFLDASHFNMRFNFFLWFSYMCRNRNEFMKELQFICVFSQSDDFYRWIRLFTFCRIVFISYHFVILFPLDCFVNWDFYFKKKIESKNSQNLMRKIHLNA